MFIVINDYFKKKTTQINLYTEKNCKVRSKSAKGRE
jgi:hypothetical protein